MAVPDKILVPIILASPREHMLDLSGLEFVVDDQDVNDLADWMDRIGADGIARELRESL